MHIVVPLEQSPDLVEEVEINAEGNDIDRDGVSLRLSEWDDQALEEALLLKDASGGNGTAGTLHGGEGGSGPFTPLAKSAPRAGQPTRGFSAALGHPAPPRLRVGAD